MEYRYAAFISYAHADEAIAKRIHKSLENYAVPKAVKAQSKDKLSPIFRDVTELTAHYSLPEKIKEAVGESKYLIVLCSPAAKASHWVNEEIQLFRDLHGDPSILSVIIEGTPETAFPPALVDGGREPLAANMVGGREQYRTGINQLAASMLGVGLDTVIQRDAQRRRNRTQMISAASLLFAAIMGAMAWTALDARDKAEISRSEAETLVEYMIKDLKQGLEPVGKLDLLDGVGARVISYYDKIPLADMDDDRLKRQARARHLLGQVALDQGDKVKAKSHIQAAFAVTEEILRRHPHDQSAIYAHAQSEYWLGEVYNKIGDYDSALPYWLAYNRLGKQLHTMDPTNANWIMEAAWGSNNLGLIYQATQQHGKAAKEFNVAIKLLKQAAVLTPNDINISFEQANMLAGLEKTQLAIGDTKDAIQTRRSIIKILDALVEQNPADTDIQYRAILAKLNLWGTLNAQTGPSTCSLVPPLTELDKLKILIDRDPSNYKWRFHYIYYWSALIKTCETIFDANTLRAALNEVLPIAKNMHDEKLAQQTQSLAQIWAKLQ